MQYFEIQHPSQDFDIIVSCDEDYRVVECREALSKADMDLSKRDRECVQYEADLYFNV